MITEMYPHAYNVLKTVENVKIQILALSVTKACTGNTSQILVLTVVYKIVPVVNTPMMLRLNVNHVDPICTWLMIKQLVLKIVLKENLPTMILINAHLVLTTVKDVKIPIIVYFVILDTT